MRTNLRLAMAWFIALLMAACGPVHVPATSSQPGNSGIFVLALPRIVIDIDSAGDPFIFGINIAEVAHYLGVDSSGLRLSQPTLAQLTASNIQQAELRQTGSTAILLINGKPMPLIGWSDTSLQEASDVAAALGVSNADTYGSFLPLARRFGLDVALRFPRQPNIPEIPLANPDAPIQVAPPSAPPAAVAHMEVKYDEHGVPAIMGISTSDLARFGFSLPLTLQDRVLANLQAHNIQTLELRVKSDGFYTYVNGTALPNILWDDALLKNATDLFTQLHPASPGQSAVQFVGTSLDKTDVDILCHFPIAAGQQPLPARMHP